MIGPAGRGVSTIWKHGDLVQAPRVGWDFDLSSVTSEAAWDRFLGRWGFTKVDEAPGGHIFIEGKPHGTYKQRIYKNREGIYISTSAEVPSRPGVVSLRPGYHLGYLSFEAPKSQGAKLQSILQAFRGPFQLKETDERGYGGIASYVKEEWGRRREVKN